MNNPPWDQDKALHRLLDYRRAHIGARAYRALLKTIAKTRDCTAQELQEYIDVMTNPTTRQAVKRLTGGWSKKGALRWA